MVDDFAPWRDYVLEKLRGNPRLHVLGVATNGIEGVLRAEELRPDLILLDISLPMLDGIRAAQQIHQVAPESKIPFLSQCNDLEVARAALSAGGHGYVVKSEADTELFAALEAVISGKQFLSARLADDLD